MVGVLIYFIICMGVMAFITLSLSKSAMMVGWRKVIIIILVCSVPPIILVLIGFILKLE